MHTLALIQNIGWPEWIIIGMIALLLFGRRLPEVGRSLGKGIVEFKRGLKDIDGDLNAAERAAATPATSPSTLPASNVTAPPAQAEQRVSRSDAV